MNNLKKTKVSAIAAIQTSDRAIGKDDDLLWHIPADMKRFKELTMNHPVIMGRKTWESIPEKFRPLSGRLNIIITRNEKYQAPEECVVAHSPEEALEHAHKKDDEEVFIIGGESIYEKLLPQTDRLHLTLVDGSKTGDTFFPEYEHEFTVETFREEHEHDGLNFAWVNLERE